MGIHDRDWYRDEFKASSSKRSRVFDRVGRRPSRPVQVRAKPPGFLSRLASASTWKIALFWVVFAVSLTFVFEPVVAKRAAKRIIEPAVQLFCSPGSKCT